MCYIVIRLLLLFLLFLLLGILRPLCSVLTLERYYHGSPRT